MVLLVVGTMKTGKSNFLTMPLPKKGFLFMYSDGLTEQCNKVGEEFGEQRVFYVINNTAVELLVDGVMEKSNSFRGNMPVNDDISICVIDFEKI